MVEGAATGHRKQPGTGPFGDAIDRPALQRHQQRVLDDFLGNIEVAQDTYQGSGEQPGLLAEDGGKGSMRGVVGVVVGHGYCSISITGRISTVPRAGQVFAMRSASSRSGTLIST